MQARSKVLICTTCNNRSNIIIFVSHNENDAIVMCDPFLVDTIIRISIFFPIVVDDGNSRCLAVAGFRFPI